MAYQRLLTAAPDPARGAIVLTWNFDSRPVEGGSTYAALYTSVAYTGTVILAKRRQAYPRGDATFDPQVTVLDTFTLGAPPTYPAGEQTFTDSDVTPGVTYYYALLFEQSDGSWLYFEDDPFLKDGRSFAKAYAYADHSSAARLWENVPAFMRKDDTDGHLEAYLTLMGYLFDGLRTDIEALFTLPDLWEVDAALLGNLAAILGWQVNWELSEQRQRAELAQVTTLYKLKGRTSALETAIQNATSWDTSFYEGWRYLAFTSDTGTTTVDTSGGGASIIAAKGTPDDVLRYTPDTSSTGWLNTFGLLAVLDQITGSEPLTTLTIGKMQRLYPQFLASYATVAFLIRPETVTEEFVGGYAEEDTVLLEIGDAEAFAGGYTEDADDAVLSAGFSYFMTNAATSTTNNLYDRTPHVAMSYT